MPNHDSETLCEAITKRIEHLKEQGRNKTILLSVNISPPEIERAKVTMKEEIPTITMDARRCPRGRYDIIVEW